MSRLPELLDLLRGELRGQLAMLLPGIEPSGLDSLSTDLLAGGRRAWGHRFPLVPTASPEDLPNADPIYAALYESWNRTLTAQGVQPAQFRHVVVCRLLDHARRCVGGAYVPKGGQDRADRDARLWAMFNGSYRLVAIEAGISERRARQIIDQYRAQESRSRQRDLFD